MVSLRYIYVNVLKKSYTFLVFEVAVQGLLQMIPDLIN